MYSETISESCLIIVIFYFIHINNIINKILIWKNSINADSNIHRKSILYTERVSTQFKLYTNLFQFTHSFYNSEIKIKSQKCIMTCHYLIVCNEAILDSETTAKLSVISSSLILTWIKFITAGMKTRPK